MGAGRHISVAPTSIWLLLVSALLTVGLPSSSAASPQRLVVARLDTEGEAAPTVKARYRSDVIGGFAAAGFSIVSDEELKRRMAQNPALGSCQSNPCLRAAGEAVDADLVLAGTIAISGTIFTAELRVIDVHTGRVVANYSGRCPEVCTGAEASDWFSDVPLQMKKAIDSRWAPTPAPRSTIETRDAPSALALPSPAQTRNRRIFRGFAIGLYALVPPAIVLGVVERTREGPACTSVPQDGVCVRRRDTSVGQEFGCITAGASFLGAVVFTYLGWVHYGDRVTLTPAVTSSSAQLHLTMHF